MRLLRIGEPGREKPAALVDEDHYVDLSDVVADFDEGFFGAGGLARIAPVVAERVASGAGLALAGQRIGAPIARPHQIICVGLNFADHAAESGQAVPEEPILFSKSPNTLVGPNDDVRIPRGSTKPDWEVELGIVIGERAFHVSEADAMRHVAGFCLVNDVSERAYQMEYEGQWVKGKSYPTHCPIGPWLVTPDELGDPQGVDLWLEVNGQRCQTGNTCTMIFGVAHIVSYLSRFMALQPGDVIPTGTPPGVGMGMKPPVFLKPGDVICLGGRGLGEQQQRVVPSPLA